MSGKIGRQAWERLLLFRQFSVNGFNKYKVKHFFLTSDVDCFVDYYADQKMVV